METSLISCEDNSKVAFNDETNASFKTASSSASKLLLTEQLICCDGSSSTVAVSVKILKGMILNTKNQLQHRLAIYRKQFTD